MNQVQVDVPETPSLILSLAHFDRNILLVVVVPELRGDENLLTFHNALFYGASDALTGFFLILIVICAVE